jgi:hypothetical protein
MARIKISDLPKDMKITKAEMRRVRGGLFVAKPVPADFSNLSAGRWIAGAKWSTMPIVEGFNADFRRAKGTLIDGVSGTTVAGACHAATESDGPTDPAQLPR